MKETKEPMKLMSFAWFGKYDEAIEKLKESAMPEDWSLRSRPTQSNPVLKNYIYRTFSKLYEEEKICQLPDCAAFNTGLVTSLQEEIFAFFQRNRKEDSTIPWFFIGWKKSSDKELMKFSALPERANFFDNPAELIFDTRLELRPNVSHIIEDSINRFPDTFQRMDRYMLSTILNGTIKDAVDRVKRNYKTAIPQYYEGKIQLLLPICLQSKAKADLALVIEKENNTYRANTCLTLDMAINNARLIAKPDDEWIRN